MLVLGIESTCDETACAVVKGGNDILSNVVSSQMDLHSPYGGVIPELACRQHIEVIIPVVNEALTKAALSLSDIDLFAVAYGPGLVGALLIGLGVTKGLSLACKKPFVGVNHIEAHLYAAIMSQKNDIAFPCLGVVLSGGHTALVLLKSVSHYELISETVDDAVGEAFDKVAKLMHLPYPGGPEIEALALKGDPTRYPLKAGQIKGNPLAFSFSGLKTGVLYTLRDHQIVTEQERADLAASFQKTAFQDIVKKTLMAATKYNLKSILFGGGVTNNKFLRNLFVEADPRLNYFWPTTGLSLDNAAMIAGLGFHRYQEQGHGDSLDLEPATRIPFAF